MTFTPRTWVVGEVVSAALMNQEIRDQFNSMFSAWTAYTPTWTASTTNPVLNDGTLTGRYMKIGRTVIGETTLTAGSSTTFGSGAWSFSLPAAAAAAGFSGLGSARMVSTDTWHGQVSINSGASTFQVTFPTSSTNTRSANASQGTPATLASGNTIRAWFCYESAS
ncbi:hypothetical protein [Streptomyces griseorubiginosus]|uniref:hypothetical protein n=1 Tax=Streptomyces griseorubiginosus TaxID=67304 RepID=UPI002E7FB911|nr:hypothetical protein [Streptomyces griseorubiginosus]WUB45337.1 hypothetical protein OHN19_19080 [Streptomyces griseorubiginosus]WUB53854.1 hypothetical protein OG942_19075 [Streptomyces griseorubiginosus]